MDINNKLIKRLQTAGIGLTHYFVLYCLANKLNWHKSLREDRVSTYQSLKRRGYIDNSLNPTDKGLKLLEGTLKQPKTTTMVGVEEKEQKYNEWFSEFWEAFPASDKYLHYPRTRTLRSNKLKAFKLYCDILNEGEYTHEHLLFAINADVEMKKKSSIVQNQLRYLQTICTWLTKRIFEGFEFKEFAEKKNKVNQIKYGEDFE